MKGLGVGSERNAVVKDIRKETLISGQCLSNTLIRMDIVPVSKKYQPAIKDEQCNRFAEKWMTRCRVMDRIEKAQKMNGERTI